MMVTTRVEGVQITATRTDEGMWEAEIMPTLRWYDKPFDLRSTYASTDVAVVLWAAQCDTQRWIDEHF